MIHLRTHFIWPTRSSVWYHWVFSSLKNSFCLPSDFPKPDFPFGLWLLIFSQLYWLLLISLLTLEFQELELWLSFLSQISHFLIFIQPDGFELAIYPLMIPKCASIDLILNTKHIYPRDPFSHLMGISNSTCSKLSFWPHTSLPLAFLTAFSILVMTTPFFQLLRSGVMDFSPSVIPYIQFFSTSCGLVLKIISRRVTSSHCHCCQHSALVFLLWYRLLHN